MSFPVVSRRALEQEAVFFVLEGGAIAFASEDFWRCMFISFPCTRLVKHIGRYA